MSGSLVNKIAAVAKSTDWVIVYRALLMFVLGITAWLAVEVYNGLKDGATASAQTASKAVQVAVAAKDSITSVAADVAVIHSKQDDGQATQQRILAQLDKLADIETTTSLQVSTIAAKLDDISANREKVGFLGQPKPD